MKIVVVGDALVSSNDLEKAAHQLNINENIEVEKFEWYSQLTKDEFQEKILEIEKGGSEAVDIPEGICEALVDADMLLVHIAPVSKKMIEAGKNLKFIGASRGGMENVAVEAATERKIPVFHVIRNAEPVADFTVALMYAETRNIARAHHAIKEKRWDKAFSNDPYKTTLANHTIGLIGLGYIGKLVVRRLNGLGVKAIAYDPFVDIEKLRKEGLDIELKGLEEVFSEADIVSLHMRVTPETTNMVNDHLLGLMKPSAYLINTARAAVVDREALVKALQNKQIAGAAIDVFWTEPLPENDEFLSLDNVTLTTHIAGDTIDAIPRSPYLLKDVLNDYFEKGFSDMQVNLK
ncbi:2-hydroxyacid dehydrogenase [Brevibacillus laterosporus]|uniref:2-hydroxyacid dehydrogenase n=1 Tax=Brevibacillus laterosporus TaxID=1465 RepID=UPI00112A3007|nr:2-hydroxyacid dehydrogenase [Brevibacillus laterosporus]MBG9801529.1 phosphoglycerate dehydrogenase [Brevibacillus laterosporus]MED4766229.1 2-hydroxyacid dehydrogenase [Brevibacillus laterosporus]TPH19047.1 phosphoglycerate dehydrogenase [Brevibacillus laterosporus]